MTLNFNSNQLEPTTQTKKYGETITITIPNIDDEYIFIGWYTDVECEIPLEVNSTMPAKNLTIYAKWSQSNVPPTDITYTVYFDANGGSGTMDSQTFVSGDTGILNANAFTRDGYEFTGWNTDSFFSSVKYKNQELLNNLDLNSTEIYLYAQWKVEGAYTTNDVWVNGILITEENANDVLANGKVSYNASTKTLTLNNAELTQSYNENKIDTSVIRGTDLTLELIGNNIIVGEDAEASSYGIRCKNLTIKGDGVLTVTSGNGGNYIGYQNESSAIVADYAIIESGTLNLQGEKGGFYIHRGTLTISGGTIVAKGGTSGIFRPWGGDLESLENSIIKIGVDVDSALDWNRYDSLDGHKYFSFGIN